MFTDAGILSLTLGIFFIIISLVGIIAIYFIIKNKSIENNNIDKIVELGKWFLISVAITLSASIINDNFRERNQDIQELAVFEKHLNSITKAGGGKERQELCEYFAAVSPKGAIRDSWERYKIVVDKEATDYTKNIKNLNAILEKESQGNVSFLELQEKAALLKAIEFYEQGALVTQNRLENMHNSNPIENSKKTVEDNSLPETLTSSSSKNLNKPKPENKLLPRVYFHIVKESQRGKAQEVAKELEKNNLIVPGVQRLDAGPTKTELRFFKLKEEVAAKDILAALSKNGLKAHLSYIPGYESSDNMRPNHFELWISSKDL